MSNAPAARTDGQQSAEHSNADQDLLDSRPAADEHDRPQPDSPDNPWHGIPPELIEAELYDKDTAGGCG